MNAVQHPSLKTLESFVAACLAAAEAEAVIVHLSECEQCLSIANQLWAERLDAGAHPSIPDLMSETVKRAEQKLRRRIRRSE
jgi:hypothetical protein